MQRALRPLRRSLSDLPTLRVRLISSIFFLFISSLSIDAGQFKEKFEEAQKANASLSAGAEAEPAKTEELAKVEEKVEETAEEKKAEAETEKVEEEKKDDEKEED